MDGVSAFVIGLAVLLVAWISFKRQHGSLDHKMKLPLGPPPFSIIGNLHLLEKVPHRKLGPIIFLRMGSIPTIITSSLEMAKDDSYLKILIFGIQNGSKEFMKTHDLIFASTCNLRRKICGSDVYNSTYMGFSPYGPYWRKMRKVCLLEL
eukprot:Gb_34180 [translate_table: standard]